MKFYLAGVMRGSLSDECFINQNYRKHIKKLIQRYFPSAEIFDPLGQCDAEQSNEVTFEEGRKVFFSEVEEVATCNVLIAFLPEASMGTAIEMWHAYHHDVYTISITNMVDNWAIKFLSNLIVADLNAFEDNLRNKVINSEEVQRINSKY